MTALGLERDIVDPATRRMAVQHLGQLGVELPTFRQLAEPAGMERERRDGLAAVDPDAPDARNLFRVHWFNGSDRRAWVDVPQHLALTKELTGVDAPILVVLGNRFPLIRAHKVLAAYACLTPRLVTGQFDPTRQRAIWPSTGNYCRGGVAIARILGCRGVAVLPQGMSAERFQWLASWVRSQDDIVRTPGSESNVKEIYDACRELARDPRNVVLNQFCEFGNHLAHYFCTGRALLRVFEAAAARHDGLALAAFVSATGSAGTLGAGDFLQEQTGCRIVAAEPLECPTMLYNGFGEHNIQGIGDKHIPLIHNVQNTDIVTAVSDRSTDALNVLFNTGAGRAWLERERGLPRPLVHALQDLGLSSICNLLAAIKVVKKLGLGPDDAVLTVATDGAELYPSEVDKVLTRDYQHGFGDREAAEVWEQHLLSVDPEHLLVLTARDRDRIFNLGYFTWVEQQGVELAQFEERRKQSFWQGLRALVPAWDRLIEDFNRELPLGSGSSTAGGRPGARPRARRVRRLDSTPRCFGCGRWLAAYDPAPFRCPQADSSPRIDHVVAPVLELEGHDLPTGGDPQPFVRFRELLHCYRFARRAGLGDEEWVDLVRSLDARVRDLAGSGFAFTPWERSEALGRRLRVRSLWIKNETQNVSGTHKARHLFGLAIWLEVATRLGDRDGRTLAIASCGNAALAAAILARAIDRRLQVFVPPAAPRSVLERIATLGADIVTCERRDGAPPGDPCHQRFRRAVAAGAIPFCCQGPDNGLTIEGGMTLAWELVTQHRAAGAAPLDRLFVQVGGGALCSAVWQGLRIAQRLGALARLPRLHAVQAAQHAPIVHAWSKSRGRPISDLLTRRAEFMRPVEHSPGSAASAILDDETYDWMQVVLGMDRTRGFPATAAEDSIVHARRQARESTGIDVDATGAIGLAALQELVHRGVVEQHENVALLFTGAER